MQTIYACRTSSETTVDVLKQSLAKALVHFYPLAGAIGLDSEGRFVVNCSKKSVAFVEAITNCTIDMIGDLRVPDPDTSRKLVYMDPNIKSFLDLPLLTVQVTKFRCGGFTLGLSISHTMADGISGMTFVNSWAEITRGGSPAAPFHGRSYLQARVPPIHKGPYDDFVQMADTSDMESLYEKERNINRMFTFSPEKIAAIKKAALADGRLRGCSTFSAVAALVWRARRP
ncbi:omega-hydroxypalmitate O-feruloyl transferase-like [Punica granatum]|uniref:Omega-hydroxypalmitate O-feruloyl transferase-like n=1 Tax=Punica granatum TaxID=22663 RepID=A0A6P8DKY7_PUNGR|nr:omega-hydroxypalmitate O-feruloyl transferase-like [Punica granatum]